MNKLITDVIDVLAKGENLPEKYKNHPLKGELKGYYDCYSVAPFGSNNTLLGVSNGALVNNTENYFAIGVYVDDMQFIYIYQLTK